MPPALRNILLGIALATSSPAAAWQEPLQIRVEAELARPPAGTRFGLVVADADGRELVAINPDGRFIPASNTKLLTTAAAYFALADLGQPDAAGGASVRLEGNGRAPNVILTGHGDARLSSAADCVANCLAALADAVAARTRRVGDIVGDGTLFPDQRWSPGMSWNNIHTRSGTAISALSLDDNELLLRVTPGAAGQPPALDVLPYYRITNRAVTVAGGTTDLEFTRLPGSDVIYLTGTIAAGAQPETLRLGIDDPAHYAAWRFRTMLEARGVRVAGNVAARHRAPDQTGASPQPAGTALARLVPPPLADDITRINKASQNVHAELLLRRVGLAGGTGSTDDGVAAVSSMMERAGVPRTAWDISDGSGMSTYNRLAPRAVVTLLRWIARQQWGGQWRASLPIAGVDGTLSSRFRGTGLERRLFAKTGGLNATSALSGYMTARSGRTLTFSFFANDVPGGSGATATMDAVLQLIADAN
jgi:D-alanyl-D-alanine carboxypeptidase/D-alanyl-D-alanine-endopeptidase (penicillin-binding protein 4)